MLGQLTMSKNQEKAFIVIGFNNWKDVTRSFEQHRKGLCHREASLKWSHHVHSLQIEMQVSQHVTHEQEKARSCLHKLFTSIEYLVSQALPLRGH